MPRQDVPYGGAICRLKERIAEIWDELGKKLHSINGVEGDGQGDVKLVSGDPAVVITDDQLQHEIEISLDTSQLPAAAVSSVNGQTGAVALTADDIPSDNGDVQTDLNNLEAADTTLQGNINAEALARQNADSTLQTNINTVSAGIPAAAAAAVAADPTVAQLVVNLGGKVDVSDVSTVETPDTIAKRNGSGRLVAADPASGATDKTLVTANWISQTGSGAPNNVLHTTGTETKTGTLILTNILYGVSRFLLDDSALTTTIGNYKMIGKLSRSYSFGARNHIYIDVISRQRERAPDEMMLYCNATSPPIDLTMINRGNFDNTTYVLSYDNDFIYIWLLSRNSPADYDQTLIKHCTQNINLNMVQTISSAERFQAAPIGTEVRRLTP